MPTYPQWLSQEIDLALRVLITKSAERFLNPQVAAWLTDEAYTSDDPELRPIEVAKRSFGIVVLPASANMLASAALGLAATPAQTVLLASERPALFFPSMNTSMLAKETTKQAVSTAGTADAWAVGVSGKYRRPLAYHWDGNAWAQVPAAGTTSGQQLLRRRGCGRYRSRQRLRGGGDARALGRL